MGASGKEKQLFKNSIAVHVWLEICIAVLFLYWSPHADAIRTGELTSSDSSGVDSHNDIVAGKNNGLYEQSDDRIQPGGMVTIDAGMVQPFNVPQDDSKEISLRNFSDLAFRPHPYAKPLGSIDIGPCDVHRDLPYTQDLVRYLPDGMPIFHVTFKNTCLGCPIFAIHIMCGDFASATLVNPNVFRKIGPNSCLLINGDELNAQETIAFEYSSTFAYPMIVGRALTIC